MVCSSVVNGLGIPLSVKILYLHYMNRWLKFSVLMLHVAAVAKAQDNIVPNTLESSLYHDATQLWRVTDNAAGLSRDSLLKRGSAYADFSHNEGTHYLVQDGDKQNKFTFFADAFQPIGKSLYGYGKITFEEGRIFNRSWNDVIRPHHSNPYFSGSSIPAKYDFQNVYLTASLASVEINKFTFGARLDYNVGDLSRLRDPRSRINLATYALTPAATYRLGSNIFGLSAHYKRRKEKLVGLSTVQTDATMKYYVYTGMENATGTTGGYKGYEREYVDHEIGGEFSYSYKGRNIESLTSFAFCTANEDVYGSNKYMPGKFHRTEMSLATHNTFKTDGGRLHSFDLSLSSRPASADEYRQQKEITIDPVTGISSQRWLTTMELKKRYEVTEYEADARYRMMWTADQKVRSYIGAHLNYAYDKDLYHLPDSYLEVGGLTFALEGGAILCKGAERSLWAEGSVGYHVAAQSNLSLSDATTDYAVNVLAPDMTYWGASYILGSLQLTYQFPFSIRKTRREWFVKAHGNCVSTNKSTNAWEAGMSLGIFY